MRSHLIFCFGLLCFLFSDGLFAVSSCGKLFSNFPPNKEESIAARVAQDIDRLNISVSKAVDKIRQGPRRESDLLIALYRIIARERARRDDVFQFQGNHLSDKQVEFIRKNARLGMGFVRNLSDTNTTQYYLNELNRILQYLSTEIAYSRARQLIQHFIPTESANSRLETSVGNALKELNSLEESGVVSFRYLVFKKSQVLAIQSALSTLEAKGPEAHSEVISILKKGGFSTADADAISPYLSAKKESMRCCGGACTNCPASRGLRAQFGRP